MNVRSLQKWWFCVPKCGTTVWWALYNAAFIRPGVLGDRWEGRTALELLSHSTSNLTFQWVPLLLTPTSPLLMHHFHSGAQACLADPLSQLNKHPATQPLTALAPHYSKGLSPPVFSHWVRPRHFRSASVYPISQDATHPPFLFPGDEWPLAVSLTARQLMPHNYSITI